MSENLLQTFNFGRYKIRVQADETGKFWFCAKDIGWVLEMADPQLVARRLDRKYVRQLPTIDNLGRWQVSNHLNEAGLRVVLVRSSRRQKDAFLAWIDNELLPTLYGVRSAGAATDEPLPQSGEPASPVDAPRDSKPASGAVMPFQFEAHAVRVQVDGEGLPWFNANDVCEALELGNPSQAIKSHVDDDDLQKLEVMDTRHRTQVANHVNESGLYALIFGSRKPAAKRFKRWVTREVLPAIRKTGSYAAAPAAEPAEPALPAATQDCVAAILLIGETLAKVPGVKPGIAAAAVLQCISENTGLNMKSLRLTLPAASERVCTLNPTQIGEQLGCPARTINQMLEAASLQVRNERDEWELTESGMAYAEALPYTRNGHSGYQILWNPEVIDLLIRFVQATG